MKKFLFATLFVSVLPFAVPAQGTESPDDGAKPVARMGPHVLTEKQMQAELGLALYEAENNLYQIKKNWIDQQAKTWLFQQAAAEAGLPVDAWRAREIDGRLPAPSQAEIDQILERFPAKMRSSTDTLRQATQYLADQKRLQKENETYQRLLARSPVEILLSKPIAPRIDVAYAPDDPVKGKKNAPVTIVEFTDFQCPYCKRAQDVLHQIAAAYPDKVKVVARQFPLPMHNRAKPAAEAALCANEQGKFWEMREKLFDKQQLEEADFKRYAQELKLDSKKFDQCLSGHRQAGRVDQDVAAGQRYGVRGTPHFFVNGQPINGAQPYDVFDSAVQDALAKKN